MSYASLPSSSSVISTRFLITLNSAVNCLILVYMTYMMRKQSTMPRANTPTTSSSNISSISYASKNGPRQAVYETFFLAIGRFRDCRSSCDLCRQPLKALRCRAVRVHDNDRCLERRCPAHAGILGYYLEYFRAHYLADLLAGEHGLICRCPVQDDAAHGAADHLGEHFYFYRVRQR